MTDEQQKHYQKLIDMNYRALMLLGYSVALLHKTDKNSMTDQDRKKYDWFMTAVKNVVYFDNPLPPAP